MDFSDLNETLSAIEDALECDDHVAAMEDLSGLLAALANAERSEDGTSFVSSYPDVAIRLRGLARLLDVTESHGR